MEIVKIYESASSDGYTSTGDRLYFLDEKIATAISKRKHGTYSTESIQHLGVKVNDGEYLLVISEKPIALADSEAAKEKIRQSALSKLSKEEQEILGLSK